MISLKPEIWHTEDGLRIYMYSIAQWDEIRHRIRMKFAKDIPSESLFNSVFSIDHIKVRHTNMS